MSTRHALELARGIGARVWDNSALQMKQIEQIGIVAVRKLANAGISSIEALEATEASRIDMLLSKNPPFGSRILARVAEFPKPRVSVKLVEKVRVFVSALDKGRSIYSKYIFVHTNSYE